MESAQVQEKIDGSIVKLWYNEEMGGWQFSTNGMIDARDALVNEETRLTFDDVIQMADNYKDIPFDALDRSLTYIFELVSPLTQVVIPYPETHLYHIGTRSNFSGMERDEDIGVEKPKMYPIQDINQCIQSAKELNMDDSVDMVHDVQKEGFVVVDKDWHRIKIKSPEYIMMSQLVSGTNTARERLVDLLRRDEINVTKISKSYPSLVHYFKYYDFKVAELGYQADVFVDLARRVFRETGGDRKAIALKIKNHRLAAIAFKALDNKKTGREILAEMPIKQYCRYIPEYVSERLGSVFYGHSQQE